MRDTPASDRIQRMSEDVRLLTSYFCHPRGAERQRVKTTCAIALGDAPLKATAGEGQNRRRRRRRRRRGRKKEVEEVKSEWLVRSKGVGLVMVAVRVDGVGDIGREGFMVDCCSRWRCGRVSSPQSSR